MISEERLVRTFLDLVAIDSPSGEEAAISEELARRFAALGATEVERDEYHNLIARFPGARAGEYLMLSAHMDTVGKDRGIKPQIRDGVIYSDGTTILGGDDKSGVAAILEVIRSLQEDGQTYPPLEAVISVSEEMGLAGARALDKGRLKARRGYVLDAGGPSGVVVTSTPSQDSLEVKVHGRTAHAGAEPKKGVNAIRVASEAIAAMPLGRIDPETTANIGVIQGGVATNIVPDYVYVKGEARSRDDAKLAAQTAAMAAAFQEAAESLRRARRVQDQAHVHDLQAGRRPSRRGSRGCRDQELGWTPMIKASGGGTDANIYAEHGIHCAIISTGMSDVHTPNEHIAIADMVNAARLLQEIVVSA